MTGSSDLYAERRPHASINHVTAHDGLTLQDWVRASALPPMAPCGGSPRQPPGGQQGGAPGRPGQPERRGGGAHGRPGAGRPAAPSSSGNVLATLLLSQGVPMLCAGDEIGRTQQGHANAYDQDNARSWLDWKLTLGAAGFTGVHPDGGRPRPAPSGPAAPGFSARPAPPPGRAAKIWPGCARMDWKCSQRIGRRSRIAASGSSWPGRPSKPCWPGRRDVAPPPECAIPGRRVCPPSPGRRRASGRCWCGRTTPTCLPPLHAPRARKPCLPAQALALLRYRPSISEAGPSDTGAGALAYVEGGERQ